MKIGVLLSGCGVYDGAEIQEAVLTLLAIEEIDAEAICISVDQNQHHVINHLNGEEMNEPRNILVESARIARGSVTNINDISPADLDALVIPGGFGSATNFTKWAFSGPEGEILPEVKLLLVNLINIGKPIAALCVSPVVLAKALEGSSFEASMTIGTDQEPSPYDIKGFTDGLRTTGTQTQMKSVREIHLDEKNKIVTAPCYMMDASILDVRKNIRSAIEALRDLV
ncbi:MAG: isoprenoid biosynthesis glyoxalase ElbB [Crocinitomicaceae bacterium]|nr:isoprenoid biosynthesis glyoxalase ElbB [Crocinitomicaceae bacterium]MDG2440847.1 isoprenoid biosynthesis glyoxalase ElbB [Crocinitomicaceae bacterium]|tara:strand:+ start:3762 stop:4442 length:681 start_codon:yes stop_codon:yes gene_type:complete